MIMNSECAVLKKMFKIEYSTTTTLSSTVHHLLEPSNHRKKRRHHHHHLRQLLHRQDGILPGLTTVFWTSVVDNVVCTSQKIIELQEEVRLNWESFPGWRFWSMFPKVAWRMAVEDHWLILNILSLLVIVWTKKFWGNFNYKGCKLYCNINITVINCDNFIVVIM